jgi:RNA polymerase sigma-70 factor (ECF subfamily)
MSIDGCIPRRNPLSEHDPLPPDDRRVEGGWRADVEALYRDRADRLIGHFTSGSADRDTARDIVHEAFAKFTALSFTRRLMVARPDAYLYRICVNLIRDRSRAQQTHHALQQRTTEALHCHNPFVELEHRDTLRRLEAAMLRLEPKTREIFLAKRLDGMSYAEIAERTGLSVKGIEKHMSKAIAMIDRAMERDRP